MNKPKVRRFVPLQQQPDVFLNCRSKPDDTVDRLRRIQHKRIVRNTARSPWDYR